MGAKANYFRTNRPDASTGQQKRPETPQSCVRKDSFARLSISSRANRLSSVSSERRHMADRPTKKTNLATKMEEKAQCDSWSLSRQARTAKLGFCRARSS